MRRDGGELALRLLTAGAMAGLVLAALMASGKVPQAVERFGPQAGLAPELVWGAIAALLLALLAAGALARRGTPRPPLAGALAAVLLAGLFWSNLDWAGALLGRDIATGGYPDLLALLPALALMGVALALGQAVTWRRVEARYRAKGVEPSEAAEARRLVRFGALAAGGAAATSAALAAVFLLVVSGPGPIRLEFPGSALAFPLAAAAGLLALAALAVRARRVEAQAQGGVGNDTSIAVRGP